MHCLDGCLMISTVVGYVSSTFEGGRMGDNLEFFGDRKSTRLNSSHLGISYAVFCLKKKKKGLVNQMILSSASHGESHQIRRYDPRDSENDKELRRYSFRSRRHALFGAGICVNDILH